MTEEKIKEIIQKMIDNNEPPEKIREFVRLAKAKMPKEDQTQEDATVKEGDTASSSETTSLDSLQLSPEAYSIVNSYRTADELKADIDAGKITNQEIINYVKGAGGEGPTDQELLVTSADEMLKSQEVTEDDQANISNTRNDQAQKLETLRVALDLPEGSTEKQISDAYQKVLDREDRIAMSDFKAPADHVELTEKLTKAGWWSTEDYQSYEKSELYQEYKKSIKGDVELRHTAKKSYFQNQALEAYIKAKMPNALDGLTPKESKDKKAQILNSEEFKEFEKEFTLDQEQLIKQEEYVAQDFLNQKATSLLEDRIQTELQKNEKSGLLYDIGELLAGDTDEFSLPMPKSLRDKLTSRETERDARENVALKELEGLDKRLKEKYSTLGVIGKDMNNIYSQMKKLQEFFDTEDPSSYTSQNQIDMYKANAKTYNNLRAQANIYQLKANDIYETLQPLEEKSKDLQTYIKAVTRDPNHIVTFGGNLANASIDLLQGITGTADMVYQMYGEILNEIDEISTLGFEAAARTIRPPRKTKLTELNRSIDEWQNEEITSQIRKPVQFDQIDGVGSAVEWGANLFAGQIPQLALMTVTGGSSLYVMGASSAGQKFYDMQEQKQLYFDTGGLYGRNHNFGTMALNAGFTGTTEALSERVTLGAIDKTKDVLGGISRVSRNQGYFNYFKKNIFTYDNIKATGKELFEEGFSESLATMSSNFADIASGDKDINIFDGVPEAFASGIVISAGIQSPRLFAELKRPFQQESTTRKVDVIASRLNDISKEMVKLNETFQGQELLDKRSELETEYANLVEEANVAIEQDVKRIDVMDNAEKAELINIERSKQRIRQQVNSIESNADLNAEQKKVEIDKLRNEFNDLNKNKNKILQKYPVNVVDAKYKQEMEMAKVYMDKVNSRGVVEMQVNEKNQQEFDDLISRDQFDFSRAEIEDFTLESGGMAIAFQEIINDKDATAEEKAEAKAALEVFENKTMQGIGMLNFIDGNASSYGAMTPRFDSKGNLAGLNIEINKDQALTNNEFNVASHEFVHAAFYNTLKADPIARERLGNVVDDIIDSGDVVFEQGQKEAFDKKINLYENNRKGEEKMTFLTEFVRANKATIKDSGLDKIKGTFRRFAQNYLGKDIKLDSKKDILNFIKDYDVSVKNNKPNKAIIRMMEKGANGKIFKDARTPEQVKGEAEFSRALESNIKSDPDLKETFDKFTQNQDGTPKHASQQAWEDSPDYWNAYFTIVEGRALDGLIQHKMTEKGLPPAAIREFTRKVKEKIGERFLPTVDKKTGEVKPDSGYRVSNDSLFGWLTGIAGGAGRSVIYRAKGDVMAEYKADPTSTAPSLDAPIGDAGTAADIIPDDSSVVEAIENEDLSIGRRDAIREIAVNELIAKDALEFSQDAKDAIKNIVADANIPLEGLTYKGFKKLMVEAMKVDKNGKLKPPTKTSDVVPVGALYNVLEVTASEFGVDPLRILANQDLTDVQRQTAQEKILELSTNQDGSFNDVLFKLLPEGETRSGEATGIANTKLGDLYTKGERVRVSEGAAKKLGQKFEQKKKTRVTQKQLFDLFGINEDGTFRPGKEADGAIRALVVQMAQVTANQQTRINALENGTATEAAAAKLADGKSELVFSRADADLAVVQDKWAEYSAEISKATSKVMVESSTNKFYDALVDAKKKIIADKSFNNIKDIIEKPEVKDKKLDYTNKSYYTGQNRSGVVIPRMTVFKEGAVDKEGEPKQYKSERDVDAPFKDGETYDQAASRIVNTFLHVNPQFRDMFSKTMTGGVVRGGFFKTVSEFDKRINKTTESQVTEKFDAWRESYTKNKYLTQQGVDKMNDKKFIEQGKQKMDSYIYDFFKAVESYLDPVNGNPDHTWVFEQLMRDGSTDQNSFIRVSAFLGGYPINADSSANLEVEVKEEHSTPQNDVGHSMLNAAQDGRVDDQYKVVKASYMQLAFKEADDVALEKAGLGTGHPNVFYDKIVPKIIDGSLVLPDGVAAVIRLAAAGTAYAPKDNGGVAVDLGEYYIPSIDMTFGKYFGTDGLADKVAANTILIEQLAGIPRSESKVASPIMYSRKIKDIKTQNEGKPSRGMSAFDFDETLIIDGDNYIIATKGDQTIKISSEQWPIQGPDLAADGFTFNFDDFINVRGGVEGPLFQKLKNRLAKYGPENNYILTARPAESATAIHGWLKSKGIDIPLKNITGLGNSTGAAKAEWMLGKYQEGYNDMYFVDDALPNVEAVADVIDQLDIKGKSEQARLELSKESDAEFDQMLKEVQQDLSGDLNLDVILEESKGVDRRRKFEAVEAKNIGKGKGQFKFFLPPSAEDLKGLVYATLGKGAKGEAHHKFFKDKIFDPYSKATRAINNLKQKAAVDFKEFKKQNKEVSKRLKDNVGGTDFTTEQAIRVYNYNQDGFDIPGVSETQKNKLIEAVSSDLNLLAFANGVKNITFNTGGLLEPTDVGWAAGTISSDLSDAADLTRDALLQEWMGNVEQVFGKLGPNGKLTGPNINKLEATLGSNYVEALSDVIYRMKEGSNRPAGQGRLVNTFQDWINGSIGATMFFNARSAVLQTLSTVNFVNWSDNNPLKAGKAFANQKQYWTDFGTIFNSPFLKQRRSGLQQDVNAREMVKTIKGSKNPTRAAIGYMLQKGFLPTQIADSFAIAAGGATFYRNRLNDLLKQGVPQKQAEAQAFEAMQEIAEETQQSARPDRISQQQASPLGKLILAFQNTPMQYNRLMKRAAQDLVNNRGNQTENVSKILYYGAAQNAIFYSMQQALFSLAFGDDDEEEADEKKKDGYARVTNGMLDTLLRGSGIAGAAVSTLKNMVLEFLEQEEKGHRADHAYTLLEMLNFSPPIGIKARKLYSATQTWEFNRDVIKYMPKTSLDNPVYEAAANATEAITNIPLARAMSKIRNIRQALNSDNETWQRVALVLGWSTWNFGIQNQDVVGAKQEIKEIKKKAKEEKKKLQKEEQKKNQQRCSAIKSNGKRCKIMVNKPKTRCHYHD